MGTGLYGLQGVTSADQTPNPKEIWEALTRENWGYDRVKFKEYHETTENFGKGHDILIIDTGFYTDSPIYNPISRDAVTPRNIIYDRREISSQVGNREPFQLNVVDTEIKVTRHDAWVLRPTIHEDNGHGTGRTSVVWQAAPNANFHLVRVGAFTGEGEINYLIEALEYAKENGGDYDVLLVNLGIVGGYINPSRQRSVELVNEIANEDTIVIAPTGDGRLGPAPPSNAEEVISVASSGSDDEVFSEGSPSRRQNDKPDVVAPGEGIVKHNTDDGDLASIIGGGSGSGYAAAHVAGMALLLLNHGTANEVQEKIKETAVDIPGTEIDGEGRVSMMNAYRALTDEDEREEREENEGEETEQDDPQEGDENEDDEDNEEEEEVDTDLTVQPGTKFLCETSIPSDVDHRDVEWEGDIEDRDAGIFMMGYQDHSGNAAYTTSFESTGKHEITAQHPDGTELNSWTISVTDSGAASPVIEDMNTEPGEGEVVPTDYTVEVTASAHDPEARLDSVYWQGGQNQVEIHDETDVSGSNDTATFTGSGSWINAGYPTLAAIKTADGRVSDIGSSQGPLVRPPFEVEIVDTNVVPQGRLEVDAEIRFGDMMNPMDETEKEIELVIDGEVADSRIVTVSSMESTTITLSSDITATGDVEVAVRSPTREDSTTVTVREDGDDDSVEVSITGTNTPVSAGEYLEVTAELRNAGGTEVTRDVSLIVGRDPQQVDSQRVTVSAGGSTQVSLGYQTPTVDNTQEFPARVETENSSDEQTVQVNGTDDSGNQESDDSSGGSASLSVSITGTNTPVQGGERLEVTADVENTGRGEATQEIALIVGNDPEQVDTQPVSVSPGSTETVTLGYRTYPAEQETSFPVRVENQDDSEQRTVTVHATS